MVDPEVLPIDIDSTHVDLDAFDSEFSNTDAESGKQDDDLGGLVSEPLFSHLLRRVIKQQWPDDAVMRDFVDYVAAPLSDHLGHVAAKGGDFVIEKMAEGVDVSRYADDQSMRAHLINGLFPVLRIANTLKQWGAPQFRYYDDTVRRLFIAGYVLHDWLKLPEVETELEGHGLSHDAVNPALHRELVEKIFNDWCTMLGLDEFLEPAGGTELLLHDLIFVACNTQIKWGTLRNLAELPALHLHGRQRSLAESLSRMADYLAYLGRDPRQVVSNKYLHREISMLSDQEARFTYQHLADVRGVLTNLIQNAALDAQQDENSLPLLFAPSGVVYLTRKKAYSQPDEEAIGNDVVRRVRRVASRRLSQSLTGFGRANVGLKYADYYHLFFEPVEILDVGVRAVFKIIYQGKDPASGRRIAKISNSAWLNADVDLDLPVDIRVDQLAEWCFFAEKLARTLPGGNDAAKILIEAMHLESIYTDFLGVPRDTRAGGVGYHWYFAAGHFLKRNPGLDPLQWQEQIDLLAAVLTKHLNSAQEDPTEQTSAEIMDGFDDLRRYVRQILSFGPGQTSPENSGQTPEDTDTNTLFAAEFTRYANAKKRGRGTTSMCSLCSSPFAVSKQKDSAILFRPQVYSNKLTLHGSGASRDICSICGLEVMLRQLLMNRTNATGKRFEDLNIRYLYFYPTYFFTPETLEVVRIIHERLKRISFTELRKQLVVEAGSESVLNLSSSSWQRLGPLLMTPEAEWNPDDDRYMRIQFPDNEPITFYFIGVPPPGRDSKDAESWVHPAFLALLLPLCIDVKMIASESPLPLIAEANELPETVFFDGVHAAIGHIVRQERINLDQVLPTLNRLAVSYLVHMDGNSGVGSRGYDYRWQDLPALAKHLAESSLYTFWYLKKWQRRGDRDAIPAAKANLYLQIQQIIADGGEDDMSHARRLTELYRQFYRAKGRPKSNSILRPISVASKALLAADRRLFPDADSLTELVRGEMESFINRVAENKADGRLPKGIDKATRDEAIDQFSVYFVQTLFFDTLNGDVSALRGKQLNLLKSACEAIYRDLDAQYWASQQDLQADDLIVKDG